MTPRRRLITIATLTALPLLALILVRTAWADSLPSSMAVHWSGSEPDRYGSPDTYFWIALGVSLLATAVATVVAVRSSADAPLWLPATVMASWTVASTWILSVALTQNAGRPEDARIGAWILVPLLGIPLAAGAYKFLPRPESSQEAERPTLTTPLSSTERAAWTGQVRGRWAGALTLAMALAATVSGLMGAWWMALLFTALVFVGGAFTAITVRIDRRGLAISSWGVRWKLVPLNTITSAAADHISPTHWGGWGYRISPQGTAVLVRSGEGIVMTRNNGRQFAVTIDSAGTGAALLNSLVAAESAH
ncbi:MAG: hypothetical protein GX610_00470 [Rhodococcus sp.]|nr:hypothetical protein [Rhodococcus sp. (in: high G+C Gram-positive bacteria)]